VTKTCLISSVLCFALGPGAAIGTDAAGRSAAADAGRTPPNVILILADDLGQGDLGVYGNQRIRTPNIDELASHGVMLTQHYASANVCTPSRAGLMTGRYPIRSGLAALSAPEQPGWGLPAAERTLAELLRDAGYATFIIGKWGLGAMPDSSPLRHGFDRFFGVPNSNDMPGFALYDGEVLIDGDVDQSTITERYTEAAVNYIGEMANTQPFFLYLAHTFPHIPLYASPAFAGKSDAGRYGDVVEELDASLGRIRSALRQNDLLDDTLIIFTSDNGPFFEGDPGPGHGGKGSTWEGGYRVPFIASWPGGLPGGKVQTQISMNIDVWPTLAEIVGVTAEAPPVDGRSLLTVLQGGSDPVHDHLFLFAGEELVGIREQQWKLVTHSYFRRTFVAFEKLDRLDGFTEPYPLLFDVVADPDERYSLADRQAGVVARLRQALAAARVEFDPLRAEPRPKAFPE
jgi:arylsulfatase A